MPVAPPATEPHRRVGPSLWIERIHRRRECGGDKLEGAFLLGHSLRQAVGFLFVLSLASLSGATAQAHTPESPLVKQLISKGIASLGQLEADKRLGGKALVGLALAKAGQPDHPRVRDALRACREAAAGDLANDRLDVTQASVYSLGIATMLLAAVEPESNRTAIAAYLQAIDKLQKENGAWGYNGQQLGDTSQTQYMALAMWELRQAGVRFDRDLPRGMIEWLHATQDPEGGWGYLGSPTKTSELKKQSGVSPTMAAAATSSLTIAADLFDLARPGALDQVTASSLSAISTMGKPLPEGVRVVRGEAAAGAFSPQGIDWGRTREALRLGDAWLEKNQSNPPNRFSNYYLYTLERYHSFLEYRRGAIDPEPDWYSEGVDYLEKTQVRPGVWEAGCDEAPDTAFAVLFLLRATQKSIRLRIGEGAMVGGRGLPKNVADATLRQGQVIIELDEVSVGDFLAAMNRKDAERLDDLTQDPSALVVGELSDADVRQLEQLLRGGKPGVRRLAAKALGQSESLDRAPALLYALTDPDRAVALEARDGLRYLSRKTRGYGMPDNFSDEERYAALERWERWFLSMRPDAVIDRGR